MISYKHYFSLALYPKIGKPWWYAVYTKQYCTEWSDYNNLSVAYSEENLHHSQDLVAEQGGGVGIENLITRNQVKIKLKRIGLSASIAIEGSHEEKLPHPKKGKRR